MPNVPGPKPHPIPPPHPGPDSSLHLLTEEQREFSRILGRALAALWGVRRDQLLTAVTPSQPPS